MALPKSHVSKILCPKFTGENLAIWKDKCIDYFLLVDLEPKHWVRMAVVHFEGAAAQWLQVYRKRVRNPTWLDFVLVVEDKFGKDDYRKALTELLELRQISSVKEYYKSFHELQFQVCMHNDGYGELFFASQFVNGLNEDIRYTVQSQVPQDSDRAFLLEKIQQRIVDRGKLKTTKASGLYRNNGVPNRPETGTPMANSTLWRERQLRDYRKANGLCYFCGDKYDPTHGEICQKKPKAQVNALAINDLDHPLTEEVLNQLAVEDSLAKEFFHLSINAIAGTENNDCVKIRAMVKNKVMLILVDSGSSHSFVSSQFVAQADLSVVPTTSRRIKLANGQTLLSDKMVHNLEWWCQWQTLAMDMRVLEIGAYDAILGYDWLKLHSPMKCHWEIRTLEFLDKGRQI
jgi:hypothetical protein